MRDYELTASLYLGILFGFRTYDHTMIALTTLFTFRLLISLTQITNDRSKKANK